MNLFAVLRPSTSSETHADAARPSISFNRWDAAAILLLLAAVLIFDCLTIRQGSIWGDDFAMYIHHAENIVKHRAYGDTGYIYNPREAWYGPRVYPPVFPLLLSPIVATFGDNLFAMKLSEVVLFVGSLLLIYLIVRKDIPSFYALGLIAILGFNPSLWDTKDLINSDFPFWFFLLLLAIVMEVSPRSGKHGVASGLGAGILLYLCYGTRSIGLLLLPCVLLYELLRERRLTKFVVVTVGSAILLICGQRQFIATEGTYVDQFHADLSTLAHNVRDYAAILASLWPWSFGRVPAYVCFGAFTVLALWGLVIAIRSRGLRPLECLLIFYLPFLLLWPRTQGIRFLLPVLPVYYLSAFVALVRLGSGWKQRYRRVIFCFLLTATALLYWRDYAKRDLHRIPEATGRPSFNDLCRYVRFHTAPRSVFVFRYARALSLFAERPASVYFLDGTPALYEEQWRYFRKIHADFVIYSPLFQPDLTFLRRVLDRHRDALHLVYDNGEFQVYQFKANDEVKRFSFLSPGRCMYDILPPPEAAPVVGPTPKLSNSAQSPRGTRFFATRPASKKGLRHLG